MQLVYLQLLAVYDLIKYTEVIVESKWADF